MLKSSRLVAHRGEMRYYPENTLPALQAAIRAGACYVEFDIQFSQDRIPLLFHDSTLQRTTGLTGTVMDYPAKLLQSTAVLPAPSSPYTEPTVKIPSLSQAVDELNKVKDIMVFVELKRHSLHAIGIKECVDHVIDTMSIALFEWTLISFSEAALQYAQQHYGIRIGWVLRDYSKQALSTANRLHPSFVFCNYTKLSLPSAPLWSAPWRWVLYDINDPEFADFLLNRGVDLIETSCITDLLQSPLFRHAKNN